MDNNIPEGAAVFGRRGAEQLQLPSLDGGTSSLQTPDGSKFTTDPGAVPETALARASDPDTSHDAAASVNVARAEGRVLDCLRVMGKANNNEIAEYLGCRVNASSPRIAPLCRKGLVRNSGLRRNRQIVWELCDDIH